jgi:cutinase
MKASTPFATLLLLVPFTVANPIDLEVRQGSSTRNDLNNGKCGDMMVIFSRGTTETGNVGTIAGPPFFSALSSAMGASAVSVQGVEYPADIPGFLAGGDAAGSKTMAALVQKAATDCPKSKIVMSGYSQGAQLVHNAAGMLDAQTAAKVNSVVMFGDPDEGQALPGIAASKVLTVCHAGDNICDGGVLILAPHLTVSYLCVFFFYDFLLYDVLLCYYITLTL